MSGDKRFKAKKTEYPGVWYIMGTNAKGKSEKVFYISYYDPSGARHFEKAGRAGKDDMTASRASTLRGKKAEGEVLPNVERREEEQAKKDAEAGRWTFDRLWKAWQEDPENAGKRGTFKADQRYRKHIAKLPEGEVDPKGAPPRLGDREPSSLVPTDIDRLRLYLAKTHAKSTTISVLGLITRLARYGSSGIWTGNPKKKDQCPGLSFPVILKGKALGKDPRVKRSPSKDQFDAYIKTCAEWPDVQAGNFQAFIAHTGIRRGSVQRLKWTDLYLDENVNLTVLLVDSKTGDLPITLSDDAVLLLRNHPRTEGVEYVFSGTGEDGMRSQRQIDRIPRQIANAAGLPSDLDPCHAFRRFLATKLKRYGTKVGMVAGGWRSPAMLLHYQSTDSDEIRAALNESSGTSTEAKSETA